MVAEPSIGPAMGQGPLKWTEKAPLNDSWMIWDAFETFFGVHFWHGQTKTRIHVFKEIIDFFKMQIICSKQILIFSKSKIFIQNILFFLKIQNIHSKKIFIFLKEAVSPTPTWPPRHSLPSPAGGRQGPTSSGARHGGGELPQGQLGQVMSGGGHPQGATTTTNTTATTTTTTTIASIKLNRGWGTSALWGGRLLPRSLLASI